MRAEQQIVTKWMLSQLDRLQWKPEKWAREAGLSPTTVTRAMAPAYNSVSSVPTLHELARAAGVQSVLDFLDAQVTVAPRYPLITAILLELLPMVGCNLPEEKVRALAEALSQTLAGLDEQVPAQRGDPEVARLLARAARVTMTRGIE